MIRYDLVTWPESQMFLGKKNIILIDPNSDKTKAFGPNGPDSAYMIPRTNGEYASFSFPDTQAYESLQDTLADYKGTLFVPVKHIPGMTSKNPKTINLYKLFADIPDSQLTPMYFLQAVDGARFVMLDYKEFEMHELSASYMYMHTLVQETLIINNKITATDNLDELSNPKKKELLKKSKTSVEDRVLLIAFGEELCDRLEQAETVKDAFRALKNTGETRCILFHTTEEKEAYLKGVSDSHGWGAYSSLDMINDVTLHAARQLPVKPFKTILYE